MYTGYQGTNVSNSKVHNLSLFPSRQSIVLSNKGMQTEFQFRLLLYQHQAALLPDQRNHLLSTLGNHKRSPELNELENHFPNLEDRSSRAVPLMCLKQNKKRRERKPKQEMIEA